MDYSRFRERSRIKQVAADGSHHVDVALSTSRSLRDKRCATQRRCNPRRSASHRKKYAAAACLGPVSTSADSRSEVCKGAVYPIGIGVEGGGSDCVRGGWVGGWCGGEVQRNGRDGYSHWCPAKSVAVGSPRGTVCTLQQ